MVIRRALFLFLIVAVCAGLVGYLAQALPIRVDMTHEKRFSLSQPSREVLAKIQEPLSLKLYFSSKVPVRFEIVQQRALDLARAYEAAGGTKIKLVIIDPDENETSMNEALAIGLKKTQANITEKARLEVVEIWLGMAIFYEDQKEVFATLPVPDNLEFEITSAIHRLIQKERPVLQMVGPAVAEAIKPNRSHDLDSDMLPLKTELEKTLRVKQTLVFPGEPLDLSQAGGVLVWGLHVLDRSQLRSLEEAILRGVPVILLHSGVEVDTTQLRAFEIGTSEADQMLAQYGVNVNRDLVADSQCQTIKYQGPEGPLLREYNLFPLLSQAMGSFVDTFPPNADLQSLLLPWVSSVMATNPDWEPILFSSDQAWVQKRLFILDPDKVPGPTSFDRFCLAREYNGPLQPYFPENTGLASQNAHLVVIGTDHLLSQFQNPGNLLFMNRLVDYLLRGSQLGNIPRAENSIRPIRETTAAERRNFQLISVALAPGLILIWALTRSFLRNRRNRKIAF
ncbi:MAG: GldG family protein [Acidobacteria bacterium]|nr:GldG family protein [Acidobacteriota bacterium]MCB9398728.1 GldG family protein [Acidobacteriota bacterium]